MGDMSEISDGTTDDLELHTFARAQPSSLDSTKPQCTTCTNRKPVDHVLAIDPRQHRCTCSITGLYSATQPTQLSSAIGEGRKRLPGL
jgi:hypothetical protein